MEPSICDTELHVQGRVSMHLNVAVCSGWIHARAWGEGLCAGRQESAVSMWIDGWIITKITHKLFAFCWRWSGQRERKRCDEWHVITMAHCLDSAPRSWTLSRSPPHKQLQQAATTTTLKRPWVCHSGCERSSIRSFQTLGPLDAWVTNRFREARTSKAQGHGVKLLLRCNSQVWFGGGQG